MDHFQSFRISGSKSLSFGEDHDYKTAPENIVDPKVAAGDNILSTVRREDWHKVSGIHIQHALYALLL
jgi:hypothetical protein